MNPEIEQVLAEYSGRDLDTSAIEELVRFAGNDVARLKCCLKRLSLGDPLVYITGRCAALGRDFFVDRRVYRPSSSTEHLLRYALEHTPNRARVLDVGTGCGWIAITVKLERPNTEVTGVDIDADALLVARQNAARHGANVEFVESDLADNAALVCPDIVIANLPYGEPSASDLHAINAHMPKIALYHPSGPFAALSELVACLRRRNFAPQLFVESGSWPEESLASALPPGLSWRQVRFTPRASIVHVRL
jgi:release factor glutamine methyltransferase